MIKRSPDALTQMNINISNAEVRIGAVEQNATHRIEVIRTEMSRALHDHKERTDRIIDQLTARVAQLEAGHDLTDPRRFGMIGRNSSISVTLRCPPARRSAASARIAFSRAPWQHDYAIVIAGSDRPWLSARLQCCTG